MNLIFFSALLPIQKKIAFDQIYIGEESSAKGVNYIFQDSKGFMWFATNDDLLRFNGYESKVFRHDAADSNSISGDRIRVIHEDQWGTLWIATEVGLDKFDRTRKKIDHFQYYYDVTHKNDVRAIYEDNSGLLWFGTWGSDLIRFDQKTNKRTCFKKDINNPTSLGSNTIRKIYEDGEGNLWIASQSCLNKFDKERERFLRYNNVKNGIGFRFITSILKDPESPEQFLWIGYLEGGLSKFNVELKSFTNYSEIRNVFGILTGDDGNLWISSNKGISKFNPRTEIFRHYNKSDGMLIQSFADNSCCKSKKTAEMFFGGLNGFIVVHPDSIKDNPHIPPIVITDFKISNQPVNIDADGSSPTRKSITETKEIQLSYNQNTFSFEFAALDYQVPEKNQYSYKMEGLDENLQRAMAGIYWGYAGSTETKIKLNPDGTFQDYSQSSYSGSSYDSGGNQTMAGGTANENRGSGRWVIQGNIQQGRITLVYQNGEKDTFQYQKGSDFYWFGSKKVVRVE